MTAQEFGAEQKRLGIPYEEAKSNYKEAYNAGLIYVSEDKGKYNSFKRDPFTNIPAKETVNFKQVTTKEDRARKLLADYFSHTRKMPISNVLLDTILENEYKGMSAIQAFQQEATIGNYDVVRKYTQYEPRNPFLIPGDLARLSFAKVVQTQHEVARGAVNIAENASRSGITVDKDDPDYKRQLRQQNLIKRAEQLPVFSGGNPMTMGAYSVTRKKPERTNEQRIKDDEQSQRATNLIISEIENDIDISNEFYTGSIPDHVKESWVGDGANIISEVLNIPVTVGLSIVNPALGISSIGARLYDGYYQEAIDSIDPDTGAAYTQQKAHNEALAYSTTFSGFAYALDKFTFGAGSRAFKAIATGGGKKAGAKSLALSSGISGGGEFIQEFAEDATQQKAITDNVNFGQSWKAGMFGLITGLLGTGAFGGAGQYEARKQRKNLQNAKGKDGLPLFKEEDIDQIFAYQVTGDTEGLNNFLDSKYKESLNTVGVVLDRILNPSKYAGSPDSYYSPKSFGFWRNVEENISPSDYEAWVDNPDNGIDPRIRDLALNALQNPSEQATKAFNDAQNEIIKTRMQEDIDLGKIAPEDPDPNDALTKVRMLRHQLSYLNSRKVTDDPEQNKRLRDEIQGEIFEIMEANPDINFDTSIDANVEAEIDAEIETEIDAEVETEAGQVDERKIETTVNVEEEVRTDLEKLSDADFVYQIATYVANDQVIPEIFKIEAERRYDETNLGFFTQQVQAKAAELKKEFKRTRRERAFKNAQLLDEHQEGVTLFENALDSLERSLMNKPMSYWLGVADRFIAGRNRVRAENGQEPGQFNREMLAKTLRAEESRRRKKQVRQALEDAVFAGRVTEVENILLNELGTPFNLKSKSAQGFIKAAELIKVARKKSVHAEMNPVNNFDVTPEQEVVDVEGDVEQEVQDSVVEDTELTETMEIVNYLIAQTKSNMINELGLGDLNFTPQELEQIMLILANEQGYLFEDENGNRVKSPEYSLDQLPEKFKDFLNREGGWTQFAAKANENLLELSNKHNFNYKQFIGFYYPLRHGFTNKAGTYGDLSEVLIGSLATSGKAIGARRKGGDPTTLLNPIEQLIGKNGQKGYLEDLATIYVIANEIEVRKQKIKGETKEEFVINAKVINDWYSKTKEEQAVEPIPEPVKALEELKELEEVGQSKGINKDGITDSFLYELIAMDMANPNKGDAEFMGDIFSKESILDSAMMWALKKKLPKEFSDKVTEKYLYTIDPIHLVSAMDGADTQNIVDGKMYGANSILFHKIMRLSKQVKDRNFAIMNAQAEVIGRNIRRSTKKMDALNRLLNKHLMTNRKSKAFLFQTEALTPKDVATALKVSQKEAEIILFHRNELIRMKGKMALSEDVRSDLSVMAANVRQEYQEIERDIISGDINNLPAATRRKRLKKYRQLASETRILSIEQYFESKGEEYITGNDLTAGQKESQAKQNKEYKKYKEGANSAIKDLKEMQGRRLARWAFETEAINNKNFFAYFESTQQLINHGDYYNGIYHTINNWADYLEGTGRAKSAQVWRTRAENHVKGDLFAWENGLLKRTAELILKKKNKKASKELTEEEASEVYSEADIDEVVGSMATFMSKVQQFNVVKNLVGNLGWMVTQISSYGLVPYKVINTEGKSAIKAMLDAARLSMSSVFYDFDKQGEKKLISQLSAVGGIKSNQQLKEKIGLIEDLSVYSGAQTKDTKRRKIRNLASYLASRTEEILTRGAFVAGYSAGKELGLTEEQAIIHGDFIAATTQTMYDSVNRNSMLNVRTLKTMVPFQSYSLTMWSNLQQLLGRTGIKNSDRDKATQMGLTLMIMGLYWRLVSMATGDTIKKALFNPSVNKFTPGSFVPYFGKDIDIKISEILPWVDDKTWMKDNQFEQSFKKLGKVIEAYADGKPGADRKAIEWANSYISPAIGIPGSVLINNMLKLWYASEYDNYEFRDISGKKYEEFYNPSTISWFRGAAFGIKAVDRPERVRQQEKENE